MSNKVYTNSLGAILRLQETKKNISLRIRISEAASVTTRQVGHVHSTLYTFMQKYCCKRQTGFKTIICHPKNKLCANYDY